MRNIITALVLVMSLCGPAVLWAKEVFYRACTADGKPAMLSLTLNDEALAANPAIDKAIEAAFVATAKDISAEELVGQSGFNYFVSKLTQEEKDAVDKLHGPPNIDESKSCKP